VSASQVIEMQVVVVYIEVVVECGGRSGDRPYCGAMASAGYQAATPQLSVASCELRALRK